MSMKTISAKAKEILNDPQLIAERDQWFGRLQAIFDGQTSDSVFAVNGVIANSAAYDPYSQPYEWMMDSLELLAVEANRIKNPYMFVPLCVETGHFGVHFTDRIFGARVFFQDGQWNAACLKTPVGCLEKPSLDCETVRITREAIQAFLDADVALPLMGLPTIASALNVAVNLYGEEILVALVTESESAAHDFQIINETLIALHRMYQTLLPTKQLQPVISWNRTQPPGYGQLCGCTTQLISGEDYRKYVAPLDNELLSAYEHGGMIHLCGSHLQHLETFRDMSGLKAVQVNDRAACDLKEYFEGLRDDQIIYLNPCLGMTVERAMEITGGRRLVIADHLNRVILIFQR